MKNSLTVALTLDFDAHSGLQDIGLTSPSDFSRGAYGPNVGVPRIIKLFSKLDLPLSCFLPGVVVEKFTDACKALRDAGFEIGHHGYTHTAPAKLTEQQEREQIERGLDVIKKYLNIDVRGYRAPWLQPSENTCRLLADYNFLYDSSEIGAETPRLLNFSGKQLVEISNKLELIDTPLYFNLNSPSMSPAPVTNDMVLSIWQDEFLAMYQSEENLCLIHTIHPFCIGHLSRLKTYERFIELMRSYENVKFVTMTDLAEIN